MTTSAYRKILYLTILSAFLIPLTGCTGKQYEQYAQAVKEQQITQQLEIHKERAIQEDAQRKHELKMTELSGQLMIAAAESETPRDDFMVPLMMSMMEDKYQMSRAEYYRNKTAPAPIKMEAPEKTSELIRASTPAVLGAAGIYLALTQSNNMADIATAGINAAGTKNTVSGENNTLTTDSNKSGSQNDISGNENSISSGDINNGTSEAEEELEEEEGEDADESDESLCLAVDGSYVDDAGDVWVNSSGCSCGSWLAGDCGPEIDIDDVDADDIAEVVDAVVN